MRTGQKLGRRLGYLVGAGCVLLMSTAYAEDKPTGPDAALRVLPAGVERVIEAAFLRAAPAWRLDSAKVQKDTVTAKVCTAAGVCHDLVLSDPKPACKGSQAGPWCLTWAGAAPDGVASLSAALAKDDDAKVWHVIAARAKQPEIMEPVAAAGTPTTTGATGTPGGGAAGGDPDGNVGNAGGETGGVAGAHGANGDHGAPPAEGENSTLLIVALVAAALATFVLFRKSDDDDEEGGAGDSAAGPTEAEPAPGDSDDAPKT